MDLEDVHLNESNHRRKRIGDEVLANLVLLSDANASKRRWRPHLRVFHVEALRLRRFARSGGQATGAANQRQWTVDEVGNDPVGNRFVVARQIDFRDAGVREEHAIRMRDTHICDEDASAQRTCMRGIAQRACQLR